MNLWVILRIADAGATRTLTNLALFAWGRFRLCVRPAYREYVVLLAEAKRIRMQAEHQKRPSSSRQHMAYPRPVKLLLLSATVLG